MSLVFVFATMVEFAGVVFLKQKKVLKACTKGDGSDDKNSDKTPCFAVDSFFQGVPNVNKEMRKIGCMHGTEDKRNNNINFWTRQCPTFNNLPLTNKIDSVGFVLFHIFYLIFNVVYWIHVLNLL